jgi:hypothetical protein
MRGDLEIGVSASSEDALRGDRDHHAIVARRDLLVAMAIAGIAGVASCNHPLGMASKSNDGSLEALPADRIVQDAVAPNADGPSDPIGREISDASSQQGDAGPDYVDVATDVYGSAEVGDTSIPPPCFCVY